MIKKNLFYGLSRLLILFSCLASAACVSGVTKIGYGNDASREKCFLKIAAHVAVTNFDGRAVSWSAGLGDDWAEVEISPGNHVFILNHSEAAARGMFPQNDLKYQFVNFVSGHTYELTAEIQNNQIARIVMRDVSGWNN